MTPLNPALYTALSRVFGPIRIANPGAAMQAIYVPDLNGRVRMNVISPGEYYLVSCRFCNDTRFRLWINHRWGVCDAQTRTRNRWLAICYNEDCLAAEENREELIELTSWYHRNAKAGRVTLCEGYLQDAGKPIALPKDFVGLEQLKKNHEARRYVRGRGFDPDDLASTWKVGFSQKEAFRLTDGGRLVIPIFKPKDGEFTCWGWQARAIAPAAQKFCKYFTSPGLKKSCLLYGLECVSEGDGPVLICEGATDVWRAGKDAVALLGKYGSEEQVRLLCKHLRGRPLVVALDPDAREEAERLTLNLRHARSSSLLHHDDAPIVDLALPGDRDAADCDRDELWRLARNALRQVGNSPRRKKG